MAAGLVITGSRLPRAQGQLSPGLLLSAQPFLIGKAGCSSDSGTRCQGMICAREVRINHFPVDILIDERLCVEVDGPDHFFEVPVDRPVDRPGEPRAVFVQQRRTKDLFIDHMLRRYGYRVVRIADAEDPASLDKLVGQVRSALDAPAAERPEPRDARERAASPDQCV